MLKARSIWLLAMLIFVITSVSGCGLSKYVKEQDKPDTALVFGYIQMENTPTDLDVIEVKQVRPIEKEPYRKFRTDGDGLFYRENLPIGSYSMMQYGGSAWEFFPGNNRCLGTVNYTYEFPMDRTIFPHFDFRVMKPGLHYVGSYKLTRTKKRIFSSDDYRFIKIDAPGERELLERLLKYTKDTKWHSVISKRLTEIK